MGFLFSYFNALIDGFHIDWISTVGYFFGMSWDDKIRTGGVWNLINTRGGYFL